jgi:cell division protease FtsH
VIYTEDVERIFGKRPWISRSQEIIEENQRAMAEEMARKRAEELEQQEKEQKNLEAKNQAPQPNDDNKEGGKA